MARVRRLTLLFAAAAVAACYSALNFVGFRKIHRRGLTKQMAATPAVEGFSVRDFYGDKLQHDDATKEYLMQQTMVRVRNPKASLDFYCKVLGFELIMHRDFPQWGFSVYFVAQPGTVNPAKLAELREKGPDSEDLTWNLCMTTSGCIELTWNHGSEGEADKIYNTGNADPTGTTNGEKVKGGFGHLGITVPDVYEACQRFKDMGCEFHKTPNSGGMKGLAFVKDPDGYLIEILPQGEMITKPMDCNGVALDGGEGYKDNSK